MLLAITLTGPSAAAQDVVPLARLSGSIVFDGLSDEPAWQVVAPLPMTVYAPTFGAPLSERTEIRVAYDDQFLYVAGRLYDSDPDGVRTNTLYRDRYSGDDVVAIILDSYNDYETAVWFTINPAGVRSDRSISNDGESTFGRSVNLDWNSFWDAATAQTDEGWFAEIRIPFTSLGFQNSEGRVVMGLIVYRLIARKNERHIYPAIPPNWRLGFAKPSQAQRVVLEGVYRRKPVYVTPYLLGGLNQTPALDTARFTYHFDSDVTNEAGLDVRYNATSNLTLDLTVNTDFAQVEADDQQINLTRFSLFFPEKRQFFQERSATYEFSTGGLSRLFHSRQIGLHDDQLIRIYGGARLVGRIGRTDIGILNMQTAAIEGVPSENFGVARVRRQVFNPYSIVGAMVTTRAGTDGSYNVAAGLDAIVRPFGDEYVTAKWAQTFENDSSNRVGDLDATRMQFRWDRRNQNGFSYGAGFARSGAAYNPGLGFVVRRDFMFLQGGLQYQWLLGTATPFRSITVGNTASAYLRNADRSAESGAVTPSLQFEFKTGARLELSSTSSYESVVDTFLVSGGPPVLPGNYWFHEGQLRYMASRTASVRPSWTVTAGSFYDGWQASLQLEPAWNPSRYLELGAQYLLNVVRFPDRQESLDAHLARLRIQTALDSHLSLNTFVQYNSTTDDLSVNARLRYNFREGRDLWLVYNETLDTERAAPLTQPPPPFTQNRTMVVKYTHTLIW